jgi:hypothetical protein
MRTRNLCIVSTVVLLAVTPVAARAEVRVDAEYPGGNIIAESIDDDVVRLRQDLRDTNGWWFYWNFRVRDAEGRGVTFRFTNKNVIGTRGPAMSVDGGQSWTWLGTGTVRDASFYYKFPADASSVRFAFAPPYQEADFRRWLKRYRGNQHLVARELCQTRRGRSVERVHAGQLEGDPAYRILLTCRHHSCESVASYTLEGMLTAVLAETDDGKWFRDHVEVLAVPFVDKDGVERGDQGKNRKPRDHNRDYVGDSIYPSVAALRELVPKWSGGRLKIALDLHCPYIRGSHNEVIYLVGNANQDIWREQCAFGKVLESVSTGAVPYKAEDNLPFGQAWNIGKNYKAGKSCSRWASELQGIRLASSMEIPYANVGSTTITPDSAREFGSTLVHAIRKYLEKAAQD